MISPRDPSFYNNPYPHYARLREQGRCFYWEAFNVWAYLNHDDVSALLRDRRFGRQLTHITTREALGWEPIPARLRPFYDVDDLQMLQLEPPHHTRLRTLVQKSFLARQIESLRPKIAALSQRLLDAALGAREFDLLPAYATPIPVITIAQLLGVPIEMKDQLLAWSHAMVQMYELGRTPRQEMEAVEASKQFVAYLRDLVKERRNTRADDLITHLIEAEEAGDRLSEEELISTCILLLNAGHEATVNVIGNGVLALLQHPDQWEKLARARGNDTAIKNAVEEMLRYDPPLHYFHRWALADGVEFGGRVYNLGDTVAVLLGAANRDPARFPNPDAFDISRPAEQNAHVSFGGGIHFCIGAPLARIELQEALRALVTRAPRLSLTGQPEYRNAYGFHGLMRLTVRA